MNASLAVIRNVGTTPEFIDVALVFESVAGRLVGTQLRSQVAIEPGAKLELDAALESAEAPFVGVLWGPGSGKRFVVERWTRSSGDDALVAPLPLWTLAAFSDAIASAA